MGPLRVQRETPRMSRTLRARSELVALAILCASVGLVASGASCGGGGNPGTSGDGGSSDGSGVDGVARGDGPKADGPLGADGVGGDAADPCAADTGGTSGTTSITAVWANEGGDKVTQGELRGSGHASAVKDSV